MLMGISLACIHKGISHARVQVDIYDVKSTSRWPPCKRILINDGLVSISDQ